VLFAVLAGWCEVGFLSFAAGSRGGIAVAAVLASLTRGGGPAGTGRVRRAAAALAADRRRGHRIGVAR
jgi:hypothetical protein